MVQALKDIINKLLGRKKVHPNALLIEKGILKHGEGCELNNMNVFMADESTVDNNIVIGNNCCVRGTFVLYKKTSKIIIGDNVYIGPRSNFECVEEIRLGDNILISSDCNIIDTNSHSLHSAERVNDTADWQKGLKYKNWEVVDTKKVLIENNCWVGLRSIIMKGTTLGEGTIVASGSVVTKSTDPFIIVGGNPAVKIKDTD